MYHNYIHDTRPFAILPLTGIGHIGIDLLHNGLLTTMISYPRHLIYLIYKALLSALIVRTPGLLYTKFVTALIVHVVYCVRGSHHTIYTITSVPLWELLLNVAAMFMEIIPKPLERDSEWLQQLGQYTLISRETVYQVRV